MDRRVIDLYDSYTHGLVSRREFLTRLMALAGGSAAAMAFIALLQNNPVQAGTVALDDPRLSTGEAEYGSGADRVTGYWARPAGTHRLPAVMVIHENRGLNEHIRDVTRRLALDGFFAFAPDLLAHRGGTPADEDAARSMIRELEPAGTVSRLAAGVEFLAGHSAANGRVGAVGFCWGGGMANRLAASAAPLAAAVAYYGAQLPAGEVPKLHAALLLHYAGLDERINAGIEGFAEALERHGKAYRLHMYAGVHHAFNNDTSAARYDEAAARLAWDRTVEFLREHLSQ